MDIDCFLLKKWEVKASADSAEDVLLRRETHFQYLTVENKTLGSEVVRPVQVKLKCGSEGGKCVDRFWIV